MYYVFTYLIILNWNFIFPKLVIILSPAAFDENYLSNSDFYLRFKAKTILRTLLYLSKKH